MASSNSKRRGLPDGFRVEITREKPPAAPVDPPDYLDAITQPKSQPTPVSAAVSKAFAPAIEPEHKSDAPQIPSAPTTKRSPSRKKQLNLTSHTEVKLDFTVAAVSRYSVEPKVRASDVADAIINAAYDARAEFDFSRVRKRGRWGTPTATAFRDSLRASFERAITRRYLKRHGINLDDLLIDGEGTGVAQNP
jgi:hypothetical protein